MTALGDPFALRFFPMTAIEEANRPEARPINVIETSRVDSDLVRL
jgi:hypothetical protein